jgi:hypothetical protein
VTEAIVAAPVRGWWRPAHLAWGLATVSVLMIAAAVASTVVWSFGRPFASYAIVIATLHPIVGAVVATRQPQNAVGWLLIAIGVFEGAAALAVTWATCRSPATCPVPDLRDGALARLGLQRWQLTATSAAHNPCTRAWAEVLSRRRIGGVAPRGLLWHSRVAELAADDAPLLADLLEGTPSEALACSTRVMASRCRTTAGASATSAARARDACSSTRSRST